MNKNICQNKTENAFCSVERSVPLVRDSGYAQMPTRLYGYRWWKPLVVAPVFVVFWFAFVFAISMLAAGLGSSSGLMTFESGGYDTAGFYLFPDIVFNLGGIASSLPALFIACRITRTPFGSIGSVLGGLRPRLIFNGAAISFAFIGISLFAVMITNGIGDIKRVSMGTAIAIIVIVPLQCAAEEYVFRGFVMQALGSWTSSALAAIVIQTLIFVAQHPYNLAGRVSVAITAAIFGYLTIRTGGLESAIAMHTANNVLAFFAGAAGISIISSEVTWFETITGGIFQFLCAVFIVKFGGKRGWFGDL